MACHQLGNCSYSDASIATYTKTVEYTDVPCGIDKGVVSALVPAIAPGVWQRTNGDGVVVRIEAPGASNGNGWTYAGPQPAPTEPPPPGHIACEVVEPVHLGASLEHNTCTHYRFVETALFPNGGTRRTVTEYVISNNAGC